MKKAKLIIDNNFICEIGIADNFWTRFKGLMFKKEEKIKALNGLWIKPCSQIHTYFMKTEIDVVYLDKEGVVVHTDRSVERGICCKTIKVAKSVLEFPVGTIDKWQIHIGDKVEVR